MTGKSVEGQTNEVGTHKRVQQGTWTLQEENERVVSSRVRDRGSFGRVQWDT